MRNFQDTFETDNWSFISAFSICMTVPLTELLNCVIFQMKRHFSFHRRTVDKLYPIEYSSRKNDEAQLKFVDEGNIKTNI